MLKDIGFLINKNNIFLLDNILKKHKNIWVEIGSGNGEFITELAQRKKNDFFIASEIKFKRVYKTLRKIYRNNTDNVLIVHGAGDILTEFFIKDNTVKNFILNFPDPWFKKRHKKRRVINSYFYKVMHDKLKESGNIFIATDYKEYADIIKDDAQKLNIFNHADFTDKWLYKDIFTKFEKSFINQGKTIYYLRLNAVKNINLSGRKPHKNDKDIA